MAAKNPQSHFKIIISDDGCGMDGELINAVLFGYQRKISDIIYFATAIPAGQNEETDI